MTRPPAKSTTREVPMSDVITLYGTSPDQVVVEEGSEAHTHWTNRGWVPQAPKAKAEPEKTGRDRPVAAILPEVEVSEDAEALQALLDEENAREKPRKGLAEALTQRILALKGERSS